MTIYGGKSSAIFGPFRKMIGDVRMTFGRPSDIFKHFQKCSENVRKSSENQQILLIWWSVIMKRISYACSLAQNMFMMYISFEGCRAVTWREGPRTGCLAWRAWAQGTLQTKWLTIRRSLFWLKKCLKYASEVKILPKLNMRESKGN